MRILTTALLFLTTNFFVLGQYAIDLVPRVSSDNSISERIAYTTIKIVYGSPKVRGREIWGEMEHYDEIWRAGANKATTISFSEDVRIKGKKLPSGTYSLFVIPRESEAWTVIFNNVADQWGAFGYDKEEDALRIEVTPIRNKHVEDLTYDIIADDFKGAEVTLEWEKIKLSFFVEVDHLDVLEKVLEERIAELPENAHWVVYLQGANYLIDNEERLERAEEWLKISEQKSQQKGEWSEQYYPLNYVKGDLLWAQAKLAAVKIDFSNAIKYAEKMKALEGGYNFYDRENEAEGIDRRMEEWDKAIAK